MALKIPHLDIPQAALSAFCERWQITEFALFGSALRDDFDPSRSDVDVLVTFAPDARWTLLDMVRMQDELTAIIGYEVDLVERQAIESSNNHIRRKAILNSARVIFTEVPTVQPTHLHQIL